MVSPMKSELSCICFTVMLCVLDWADEIIATDPVACENTMIKRFIEMNPLKTNIIVSNVDFQYAPRSGDLIEMACDRIDPIDLETLSYPLVNAVINCNKLNLEVIDTLIYKNSKSVLPPGDIILDKPFFNILLITNSSYGIIPNRTWVKRRESIYDLKVGLICSDDEKSECAHNISDDFEQIDCSSNSSLTVNKLNPGLIDFKGRRLNVVVVLYTPFVVRSRFNRTSPYQYYGYCLEILEALSRSFNFRYKISRYRKFGVELSNGKWTGSIGRVSNKRADIVLTGMSIMAQRAKVLDFTYPFWEEPTGILMRTKPRSSFMVARPLKPAVWLAFVGAIVIASFVAFIFEVVTLTLRSTEKKKTFSFWDTLWFAFGIAMWQSADKDPATRTAAGILLSFRFISIIILVTYSANLVSNLTFKETDVPFDTLEDLAQDSDHALFMNEAGAHRTLLEDAHPESLYGKLWKKAYLVPTSTTGVNKVMKENFTGVVITDKTSLIVKAARTKQCNWALLKEDFFKTTFGMGLPKHSPFTELFSLKIQQYQGVGLLKKWEKLHIDPWRDTCQSDAIYSSSTPMSIADMWPVFVILCFGAILSLFAFCGECIAKKSRSTT